MALVLCQIAGTMRSSLNITHSDSGLKTIFLVNMSSVPTLSLHLLTSDLWVGTTQCRSASDSLQKGAELFFPAPNRLFFFHLLFISPMNMLFRGVVPPLHNLENWGKWTHFIKKGIKKSALAKKASADIVTFLI